MTPVTTSPSVAAVTAVAGSSSQTAQAATAMQLGQLLGQTIAAQIVASVDANTLRLAIPGGTIDVQAAVPLPPGTQVQLAVSGTSASPQVVLTASAGAVAAQAAAAQSGQPQALQAQPQASAAQTPAGQAAAPQSRVQVQPGPASGATQTLGQLVGQNVSGRVIAVTDGGTTLRLATPAGTVDIRSPVALPVGTQVQLAVSGSSPRPQLALTAVGGGTIGGGSATSVNVQASPSTTPAQPATPSGPSAAALSAATALARDATARQGGLAALYADLEALVSGQATSAPATSASLPSATSSSLLPSAMSSSLSSLLAGALAGQSSSAPAASATAAMQPIIAAARQSLALRLDASTADGISAAAIKSALTQSGLSGALALASGQQSISPGLTVTTALISLRNALKAMIDAEVEPTSSQPSAASSSAASAQASPRASTPMPPYRGAPTVAQAATTSSLPLNASPRAQAEHLLARVDAALARQSLLQIAALPGGSSSAQSHGSGETAKLLVDIPLATGQGTAVAQLLIEPDQNPKSGQQGEAASIWRASFSIDVEPIGPVHVRIALSGERASVTMTAERGGSAERLADGLPMLQASLREAELEPGDLRAQSGRADTPEANPGLFVNVAS